MQRVHVKRRRRRHKTWSEVSNELGVLLGALRPLRTVEQRGHDDHLVRGRVRARVRVRGRGRGRGRVRVGAKVRVRVGLELGIGFG